PHQHEHGQPDHCHPRRDARCPYPEEASRPDRPHQPPPQRSLHEEREAERGPQPPAVPRRHDEAQGQGGRGNRCQPRDVARPSRHRPSSSLSLESVRIREYRVPPNPTNAPTIVNTPSVPAFLSSHCPTSTKTTSVAASWRPSPA